MARQFVEMLVDRDVRHKLIEISHKYDITVTEVLQAFIASYEAKHGKLSKD